LLVATAAVLGPPLDDFSTEDSAATAVEKPDQGVCVNKGSSVVLKIEEKGGGGGGAEHAATTLAAATAVTVEATAKADEKEFQVRKPMVAAILALLVLQNAGASLVTAAVRKTTPYDGASVALLQEVAKVRACYFLCRSITWLLLC
jgi:fructose-specific phosphotransferase system component IIB